MLPLYRFGDLILGPQHIVAYTPTSAAAGVLGKLWTTTGDFGISDDESGRKLHDWIISQAINPQEQKDAGQV